MDREKDESFAFRKEEAKGKNQKPQLAMYKPQEPERRMTRPSHTAQRTHTPARWDSPWPPSEPMTLSTSGIDVHGVTILSGENPRANTYILPGREVEGEDLGSGAEVAELVIMEMTLHLLHLVDARYGYIYRGE